MKKQLITAIAILFSVGLNAQSFEWAISFVDVGDDVGISNTVDAAGNVYTTGIFQGTVDFDPGTETASLASGGADDVFVQKLSQCAPNTGSQTETACYSNTWPANSTTYNTSGIYTTTLTNAAGCDSLVTLNLTINSVSDNTTSISGLTITAKNSEASYQWLDCNNNYASISGETGQTFSATVNGNYAVAISENGCVDTSACVAIVSVGLLQNTIDNVIRVFPNPSVGELTIDLGSVYESTDITIRDAIGRIVATYNYTSVSTIQISLNDPSGIYFIEIVS